MAKKTNKKMEDIDINFEEETLVEVPLGSTIEKTEKKEPGSHLINCLRNEKIIVRHIPKQTGLVTNPRHVLYGGMAEHATRTFVVPKLSSGMFKNVLTDEEKDFLEDIMGLEVNALSIYKKGTANFWDDTNENGINKVRLTKQDTYLDLRNPEDYIKYKILLANSNIIAPSLAILNERPKATYQFVLIGENSELQQSQDTVDTTMECYVEFSKIKDDYDTLKVLVETLDGRPLSSNTNIKYLQNKANSLIQANAKLFYNAITDKYLNAKVLIKKCIEANMIVKRGDQLYLRDGNMPLCENNEEPTFNIAARYLSNPKHQELKYALEAKLNNLK